MRHMRHIADSFASRVWHESVADLTLRGRKKAAKVSLPAGCVGDIENSDRDKGQFSLICIS